MYPKNAAIGSKIKISLQIAPFPGPTIRTVKIGLFVRKFRYAFLIFNSSLFVKKNQFEITHCCKLRNIKLFKHCPSELCQ